MFTEGAMTVRNVLESRAQRFPDHIAILTPNRPPLPYRVLNAQTQRIAAKLQRAGIGRGDRVAIVLPDSAEIAVAVLSVVSAAATAVFLKSTLRAEEYSDLFSQMHVKTVIAEQDTPSAAREATRIQSLPVIDLIPRRSDSAGLFDLITPEVITASEPEAVQPDDNAWIVTTSGTTGRPKVIPLTHMMLWYRIKSRAAVLGLDEDDQWLALGSVAQYTTMANILQTFFTGGSVVIAPNFDATQIFDYLDNFRPTWCTAPATMYQAILAQAALRQRSLAGSSLRFVRSGSMALPPELKRQMELAFQVPILQGYGITEAGFVANNPLPPAPNKPGSVGLVTGHEVQIVDEVGKPLAVGTPGEVVLRGPAVMVGYEGDAEANRKAFFGDWFRTGDQGYLDEDGYLFITGRIKELINRGGEMISPAQIEDVLLTHPAVAQAVVFPMPEQRLGEDVAAAVVLRPAQGTTEQDLRTFAAQHLAPAKVPRRILVTDDIPHSDAGKVQRSMLAERFGLSGSANSATPEPRPYVAPRNPLEMKIAELWQEVLAQPQVGVDDEFLDLGGESLSATRLISRLRRTFAVELTLLDFFDAPTVAQQARVLENLINR